MKYPIIKTLKTSWYCWEKMHHQSFRKGLRKAIHDKLNEQAQEVNNVSCYKPLANIIALQLGHYN